MNPVDAFIIVLGVISFSRLCDSFCDAICFGNNQRWMKELWHLSKGARDYTPYCVLIWFVFKCYGIVWWVSVLTMIGIIPILWVLHEFPYQVFKRLYVWELDRKLKIKWLCKVWGIPFERGR